MSIIVVNNDSWYVKAARDILLNSGKSVVSLLEDEFITTFQPIIREFTMIPVEDRQSLTILVDVENIDAVEYFIKILKRNTSILGYIRIVLVSSLLTWCGKSYASHKISDYDAEFLKRIPIASANDSYLLENSVYGFCKQNQVKLSIIGVGLIYGGAGFDFKTIFNNIWTNESVCKLLTAHSKSNVPIIHHEALVRLIVSTVENADTPQSSVFIPAAEYSNTTIQELINTINATVNPKPAAAVSSATSAAPSAPGTTQPSGNPSPQRSPRSPRTAEAAAAAAGAAATTTTTAAAQPAEYVQCEELGVRVEKLLYDTRSSLWGADVSFQVAESSEHLLANFPTIWKEFTEGNSLKALSVIVTGHPKVGKTTAAKQIATELNLEYVDVMESAKCAFTFSAAAIQALNPTVWNTTLLSSVKSEIDAVIEAKLNEGVKKGGKADKNAPSEPQVFEVSHLTEVVVAALPLELQRKCVAIKLLLDTKCVRYGYVLDLWGLPNDIFNGHTSLGEILNSIRVPYTGEDLSGYLSQLVNDRVELLVELQLPSDSVMVERLVSSQGANAKAKDSQAAVKALEAVLAAYRGNLVPATAAAAAAEGTLTHKGVDELERLCGGGGAGSLQVLRLNGTESSADVIAGKVVDRMFDLHQRQIGWLPARPYSAPEPVVLPAVAAGDVVDGLATSDAAALGAEGTEPPVIAAATTTSTTTAAAASDTAGESSATVDVFAGMAPEKLSQIAAMSQKSQSFLSNTLLPHIATAMVLIRRQRPEDPIQFMADYLMLQSESLENEAREKAKEEFYDLLGRQTFSSSQKQ